MNKGFISPGFHSVLDYIGGLLIASSPWLFGFVHLGGAALFIPLFLGCMQLVMTIFTDHPGGLIKVLPFQLHLVLDMFSGFIILVSPFLWGFCSHVYLPHLLLGLLSFCAGLFTQPSPFLGDKFQLLDSRGMQRI
ncbi:hypothetical protein MUY27_17745 [Mucilaginibacter sp. RS28]|uniref:SPW repeat-containing integral membrane domain-containing protein n=1 Tax=Mucilaginibacter straminoryzae TaxID=2932774 RepID=A0A9X1X600_9SPHI|nr:hypothetical protein [Mucilaginibacter straminoryzae]MCJ8211568.1 hypothetical protein [Mucilaginibacter straminoryzae]